MESYGAQLNYSSSMKSIAVGCLGKQTCSSQQSDRDSDAGTLGHARNLMQLRAIGFWPGFKALIYPGRAARC
jgi:hypothetical protein